MFSRHIPGIGVGSKRSGGRFVYRLPVCRCSRKNVPAYKASHQVYDKWSIPTAVLGGVVLISTLIFLMNYNHPYSEISREYVVTTPIVPAVSGTVVSVSARPLVEIKQGEVLFNLDPVPFQNTVNSLTAEIALAKQDSERARTLLKSRNISQRDADAAFTRQANLEGRLATAAQW